MPCDDLTVDNNNPMDVPIWGMEFLFFRRGKWAWKMGNLCFCVSVTKSQYYGTPIPTCSQFHILYLPKYKIHQMLVRWLLTGKVHSVQENTEQVLLCVWQGNSLSVMWWVWKKFQVNTVFQVKHPLVWYQIFSLKVYMYNHLYGLRFWSYGVSWTQDINVLLLLLVFSPWAGLGRDQSSVRRLVWLWYAASWASS